MPICKSHLKNTQTLSLPDASIVTANGTSNEIVWVVDEGVQRSDSLATGNFSNVPGRFTPTTP